jgi:triosephosphate isomerase (TIM)
MTADMRTPIFAANWKMHHGPQEARAFLRTFLARYARRTDRTVAIVPPALTFHAAHDALRERTDILLGVQNIHWEEKGAFTGENSAPTAKAAGARIVLVGHSERRHVFGERDEETALKCAAALRHDVLPVLCVGEKLDEREADKTSEVVLRQLRAGLARLEPSAIRGIWIAYEPVWAIGTGRTAQPEDASAVHAVIRGALRDLTDASASEIPILYGGSVNTKNVAALLSADQVDGVLVGGASLDAEGWAEMVRT